MKDDYELLDSGDGRKLERFGKYVLARPCSQALWRPERSAAEWARADASFDREDGNHWHGRTNLPKEWEIETAGIRFKLGGTDFGHLGIFPEQRAQWKWIREMVRGKAAGAAGKVPDGTGNVAGAAGKAGEPLSRAEGTLPAGGLSRDAVALPVRVLNLFAYSGGSSLAAALGGAEVCHLDASRGMVEWARGNAALNGLAGHPMRWIVDDAHKFMRREIRRARKYDAIILDPPTFGRGAGGEMYKIERDLKDTLELVKALLSDTPAFVLFSSHTPGLSQIVAENILGQLFPSAKLESGEMLLEGAGRPCPSGIYCRAVW